MALDWSREITFSGLRRRSSKPQSEFPEKTYMNLVVDDARSFDARRTVPMAVVLVIVVALFLKFGIFDFYARVDAKQAELNVQKQVLNGLTADLVNYDEVLAEYEGYESMSLSDEGLAVDVLDAFALVDRFVSPSARVSSIALSGNTMSLNLTDITLDGVGKLVSTLYEQDIVLNVSVSTAATEQTASEDVMAAMTITLSPDAE